MHTSDCTDIFIPARRCAFIYIKHVFLTTSCARAGFIQTYMWTEAHRQRPLPLYMWTPNFEDSRVVTGPAEHAVLLSMVQMDIDAHMYTCTGTYDNWMSIGKDINGSLEPLPGRICNPNPLAPKIISTHRFAVHVVYCSGHQAKFRLLFTFHKVCKIWVLRIHTHIHAHSRMHGSSCARAQRERERERERFPLSLSLSLISPLMQNCQPIPQIPGVLFTPLIVEYPPIP